MTIRLITGPPGAGKNTYIEKHKKPEDVVFDFDQVRELVGGSIERAKVLRQAFEDDLQNYESDVWVIRCVADAAKRAELATRLKAEEVVVIETPADVAKEQVKKRGRNPEKNDEVFTAIDNWWSQYGVVESDLIVRPDTGQPLSDRKKNMSDNENEKSGPETDKGFPAETKIADMTAEEQAAYWKFQSRKHESKVNALRSQENKGEGQSSNPPTPPANTPIDADALRKQILAEIKREQAPTLVRSTFESLIGDRLPETTRNAILEDLNFAKFVSEDGSIDTDKIKAKAELLAPADSQSSTSRRRTHQGPRRQEASASVKSGFDLFEAEQAKNKRG